MTRREFLRRYFLKFAAALTLVGLIVYTLYHALGSAAGSLLTAPARRVTDVQILGGDAVLFRAETVLDAPSEGLVDDLADSGSKVGRDVTVAQIWENRTDLSQEEAQRLLYRYNRLIAALENGVTEVGESKANASDYKDRANADFLAIKQAAERGDLSSLDELEDDMLAYLCRYATLAGLDETVSSVLSGLKGSKAELLQSGNPVNVINTGSSGYYYNRAYVDGGEEIFTTEALDTLTTGSFDALQAQFASVSDVGFSVGKIVHQHEWYAAVDYESAVSALLTVGAIYQVTFPENGDLTLPMTCERIVEGEDGREIVILKSSDNPKNFDYLRIQRIEIETDSCNGYYVPEQALRTVKRGGEEVDGVYVFENSTVYFRKIEILYRGDGYVIVAEQGDRGGSYLALNDSIVLSGTNLYDGRVLK